MVKLHERVLAARLAQGRKIAEVARAAEVDAAHLYRFELGARDMSGDKIDRLLSVLSIEVAGHDPGTDDGGECISPSVENQNQRTVSLDQDDVPTVVGAR